MSSQYEYKPENKDSRHQGIVFAGLGFELFGMMLGSAFIGQELDKYFNSDQTFLLILIVCSFVTWCIHFFVLLNKMMKREAEQKKLSKTASKKETLH